MRAWILAGFLAVPLLATDDPPKCEKANRSMFWPEVANDDARAAVRLAREGKLLICTQRTWRYKWQPVSMNIKVATAAREKREEEKQKN